MTLQAHQLTRFVCRCAAVCCLAVPALSAQSYLSLEEAIRIGLRDNLDLRAAEAREDAAGVNTGPGAAGLLPSVTANGGGTFTLDNATQTFLDGRENKIVGGNDLRLNGGVRMDWTIFEGRAGRYRRERLRGEFELAALARRSEEQRLAAEIARSYEELVLQAQVMNIFEEDLRYLTDLLQLTEAKLSLGSATRLDVLQAQTDRNELLNSRELARLQYELIAGDLNQNLNRAATTPVTVDTAFLAVRELPAYEQWAETALAGNPDLRASAQELLVAEYDIKIAEAERLPTFDLNAGANFGYLRSNSGFLLSNRSYGPFIGFTGRYNIFDGNRVDRNIAIARINVSIAKLALERASLSTRNELYQLYQTYRYYVAQARVERENLTLAEENFFLADELYRNGRINQFELRQVRLQRLDIERRLARAEYEQVLAYVGLRELSGEGWR